MASYLEKRFAIHCPDCGYGDGLASDRDDELFCRRCGKVSLPFCPECDDFDVEFSKGSWQCLICGSAFSVTPNGPPQPRDAITCIPAHKRRREFREARPTEWKGVVYRSKSEACMAYYLSSCGFRIEYEPDWLSVDGWKPDFAAVLFTAGASPGRERFSLTVIEYKPSNPTATYRDELWNRFRKLHDSLSFLPSCFFELWVGSFFDDRPRSVYRFDPGGELLVDAIAWPAERLIDAASRYRFDLEAK